MKIVTGYTGSPHITSNDEQGKNQGIFGTGNSVLDVGNKFNATLTNANTVTIEDGEGVMQGVHFRIEPGTTETVNIQNGTSGYNRTDLICARYTKNAVTGVEAVKLVVIPGTPSTGGALPPSYIEGDILAGDTEADFPLYYVYLNGLTPHISREAHIRPVPESIETLFNLSSSASVVAGGQYEHVLEVESGVWILDISFRMTFASGTFAASEWVSLNGPLSMQINVGGTSAEVDAHACGLFGQSSTTVTIVNGTSKAATLQSLVIKGIRIA